jgi:hypothetical protein
MGPDHETLSAVGGGERGSAEPRSRERAPFAPDEAWITAYEEQLTPVMVRRCVAAIAALLRSLAGASRQGAEPYARELVQDALTDTFLGVLRWTPTKETLDNHLRDVIRWRVRNERQRVARQRSLDDPGDSSRGIPTATEEIEAVLAAALAHDESAEERAIERLAELRRLAEGDAEVSAMIEIYERGARSRADVMVLMDLSSAEYKKIRARLCRLGKGMRS